MFKTVSVNVCIQEGSGFVAVQTSSYVVYGSYSSSMFPSVCVEALEKLGNHTSYATYALTLAFYHCF